ncbi:response regulator [Bacillus gobiensis]|uniref:response regulator n=1 Tax=Bacillus gobiensis TaxID=1441095 RepID=UPI003D1C6E66
MIDVLIVEDDPMVGELNKRYIEQLEGFNIVGIASSYQHALQFIKTHQVDLVLLDIYMPGKNGIELLQEIRTQDESVDVLIISAASEGDVIRKAMRLGAVDYLIKPFENERFHSALNEYKRKQKIFLNKSGFNQKDLDQELLLKKGSPDKTQLPKGLTKSTLKLIWNSILSFHSESFTTEDVAKQTEISQVSTRKYLKFLEDIQVVHVEMAYGTVGRPVFQYKINYKEINNMIHYL